MSTPPAALTLRIALTQLWRAPARATVATNPQPRPDPLPELDHDEARRWPPAGDDQQTVPGVYNPEPEFPAPPQPSHLGARAGR